LIYKKCRIENYEKIEFQMNEMSSGLRHCEPNWKIVIHLYFHLRLALHLHLVLLSYPLE
jgi:hypothetical protein